ncbi:small ribosomal subunit biogenesis GTPase RsgA [Gallibacterium trehalosifermentans]|uniref:Small ribosomal subunit biogenesis GTPase RsgA n=1 Tax=Gallibacterium trehalosifermentans TaxID=516935 RepID=A0ABV6H2J5_9PAST
MSKRKLTHNQQRRIASNQHKNLRKHQQKLKQEPTWQEDMLGAAQEGIVVTRYSQHVDVENLQGEKFRCNLRRTLSDVVVGDRVIWRQGLAEMQGISGVVEAKHPRTSELSRPDYYDGLKVIAANIDQIVIVSAIAPKLSLNIIDRYLVICEKAHIKPVIVINKIDLLDTPERAELDNTLKIYQQIGYQTLMLSTFTGEGMTELITLLAQGNSIFVGQSGVGKSSLVKTILPEVDTAIGEISEISGLGQHTTTSSTLYHLPQGGNLIDSPGIREFGLWHLEDEDITYGYREFLPYLGTCKFKDCKHLYDPGCSIREAVEEGKINPARFENYHRLISSKSEMKSQRHFVGKTKR